MRSTVETRATEFRRLVGELAELLDLHARHHGRLVALLRQKKDLLIRRESDDLSRILDLEREVIGSIATVEEERVRVTREVARHLGKPAGSGVRLRELVMHVDGELRDALLELRDELREIADDLERLNGLDRTLTVQSFESVGLHVAVPAAPGPCDEPIGARGSTGGEPCSY